MDTHVLQDYPVGGQSIIYDTVVIGGSNDTATDPVYRADSFICQAAIHAGVVSNTHGGCGVALLKGAHQNFTASSNNTIVFWCQSYTFSTTNVPFPCVPVRQRDS